MTIDDGHCPPLAGHVLLCQIEESTAAKMMRHPARTKTSTDYILRLLSQKIIY